MTDPVRKPLLAHDPACAADFIAKWEGFAPTAYRCPAGLWTIGYGHTEGVQSGHTITMADARRLLIEDINNVAHKLARFVIPSLTEGQYIALVSLAFNLGVYGVVSGCPKLMRALNAKHFEDAAVEFLDADHCNGKRLSGLTKRRHEEAELFLGAPL